MNFQFVQGTSGSHYYIDKDFNKEVYTNFYKKLNKMNDLADDIESCCSSHSDNESVSSNVEPVRNNSLKFGIANILKESEHSVTTETSFSNDEQLSKNMFNHTNSPRLLFNPYFMPNSSLMWPLQDLSRDRQICKYYFNDLFKVIYFYIHNYLQTNNKNQFFYKNIFKLHSYSFERRKKNQTSAHTCRVY